MKGLIDTHCHLIDAVFDEDLAQVLSSAKSAGVEKIVVPAVDLTTSRKAVEVSSRFPQLFASVGVHPEAASSFHESDMEELFDLAQDTKVVAIGEIGLDFHYPPFDRTLQEHIFIRMLELAAKVNKPVIVHSRDTIEVVLEMLKDWTQDLKATGLTSLAQKPGILHAFEGNFDLAIEAVHMNFALGLGGPLTYKNADEKATIAREIEIEHLVLETDSPYLPPHPYRGQRNEPAHLLEVAIKLSEIKKQPVEEIARCTGLTATRILKLDE